MTALAALLQSPLVWVLILGAVWMAVESIVYPYHRHYFRRHVTPDGVTVWACACGTTEPHPHGKAPQ